MSNTPKVTIYTDGSCFGNPGPGGYAAILSCRGHVKELCGNKKETTNNQMELTAVITALEALKKPCSVTLFSDSKYIVDAINKNWISNWIKNGWTTSTGSVVANQSMWVRLIHLLHVHDVKFIWVKGHSGEDMNEKCDKLAKSQAEIASR